MPILGLRVSGVAKTSDGKQHQLQPAEALRMTGPLVQATLTFPDAVQRRLQSVGQNPGTETGMAMFDTGATSTFIDNEAAERLGLPVIGVGNMTSASEANVRTPKYTAKLVVPSLNLNLEGALGANLAPHRIIALIGRDVLQRGILIYNGLDGSFSFST